MKKQLTTIGTEPAENSHYALAKKILTVLEQLKRENVQAMGTFDGKGAGKPGEELYRAYMSGARKEMASLGSLPSEGWESMTPWQKLCVYKVSGGAGVDCDAALRNTVLYALAYGLLEEGWRITPQGAGRPGQYQLCFSQHPGWVLRGDTMNSYASTTRMYLRKIFAKSHRQLLESHGVIQPKGEKAVVYLADRYDSKEHYWEQAVLDQYDLFQCAETPELLAFFQAVHTLGNFVPVPFSGEENGAFNGPRGLGPSRDYWDLALACICNYYAEKGRQKEREIPQEYTLEWLLRSKDRDSEKSAQRTKANVELCEKWLNTFGTWDNFVTRNFFQDFVWKTHTGWGTPKELWTGHFKGSQMPGTEEEFQQFFSRAAEWSSSRGERIAAAAKAKLNNQDLTRLVNQMAGVM